MDVFNGVSWSSGPPTSISRSNHAVVAFNNRLYVIGGYNNGGAFASVEYLDEKGWSSAPQMNYNRFSHGAVEFKSQIYTMGGYDGASHHSSMEKYDGFFIL